MSIEEHIQAILQLLDLDLKETPQKVAQMLKRALVKPSYPRLSRLPAVHNQQISLGPIRFMSTCAHHLTPFFGTATISYMPNKWILGLGTIARLVSYHAVGATLQEKLTAEIARDFACILEVEDVEVALVAQHTCANDPYATLKTTTSLGRFQKIYAMELSNHTPESQLLPA
ncbi:MAG: GTP cyclohydrolase I [Chlamydiales bacterium]